MKYSIDKIEDNIVVLESLEDKSIKEIDKKILDFNVKEKDILIYKDNKYYKDDNLKNERIKLLQEKLNKLKNLK